MTVGKPIRATDPGALPSTPIVFKLDPASGVPTYLQLVRQVEHALLLGYLAPGDQLPKVRDVVADLAINPNTVLKAYRELEHKGIAAGRPGLGTFVESGAGQGMLPELAALRRRLRRWLSEADAAGLEENSIVALFTTTLRDFTEGRGVGDDRGDRDSQARSAGGAA
jgi:GntR family transcriptional regulator